MVDWGILRSRSKVCSLEDERDTKRVGVGTELVPAGQRLGIDASTKARGEGSRGQSTESLDESAGPCTYMQSKSIRLPKRTLGKLTSNPQ